MKLEKREKIITLRVQPTLLSNAQDKINEINARRLADVKNRRNVTLLTISDVVEDFLYNYTQNR